MLWTGLVLLVLALALEVVFGHRREPWNWANKSGKVIGAMGILMLMSGAVEWAWAAAPY